MLKLNKIHSDKRGAINCLVGDCLGEFPEISIFQTFANKSRGGCVHTKSKEHICVLVGEIEFIYGEDKEKISLRAGDSFTILPNTPHYFIALQDSVVMEWGPQLDEKNQKHFEFRKIVDEINNREILK